MQGMLTVSPDSFWMKTIQSFLDKKKQYGLDAWGVYPSEEREKVIKPLVEWIDKICPTANAVYPGPWGTERHVMRQVMQTYLSGAFSDEFAEQFRHLANKEDLDRLAHSFHFDECKQREGLNKILRAHAQSHGVS